MSSSKIKYNGKLISSGYVTHATDQSIWTYRVPDLASDETKVALAWLDEVAKEVEKLGSHEQHPRGVREVLALTKDKTIEWIEDTKWDEMMRLARMLRGGDI